MQPILQVTAAAELIVTWRYAPGNNGMEGDGLKTAPASQARRWPENERHKMVIIIKNSINGKVCSTCRKWKPLDDFPTDPTHGPSQGGRHCSCKECHRTKAKLRRQQNS